MSLISQPIHLPSFFMGGFECAAQIRRDGRRLDLLSATRHDVRIEADYRLLQNVGIRTVRDGLRWHRIEASPGRYDWSSFLPMLRGAHDTGTEVFWDLCHWGVPDWLNPFDESFPLHFERFAAAVAETIAEERSRAGVTGYVYLCPINEISFWSWAGGSVAYFAPLARGRGPELKRQLVLATIRAIRSIRSILTQVRFLQAEPLIHIASNTRRRTTMAAVRSYNDAQFEAFDMIAGRLHPELGGSEDLLDIVGVNYYWNNQWMHKGAQKPLGHPAHVPLHQLLLEVQQRYSRPLLLSETGAEGHAAMGWLGMICAEVRQAHRLGANVQGVCLYPVCDYPGWDNNRHVSTGLLELDSKYQARSLRPELASELALQAQGMSAAGLTGYF